MYGAKTEVAAIEKSLEIEIEYVPFDLTDYYTPKHPEVVRRNPKHQVPVLVDGDLSLYDSTLIFEYFEGAFPEPPLWPTDPQARARARLLELEADEVMFAAVQAVMPHRRGGFSDREREDGLNILRERYRVRNRELESRDYLAGQFSYADIALFGVDFYARFLRRAPTEPLPGLDRWRSRMTARASIAQVFGRMCDFLGKAGLPASLDGSP